MDEDKIKSYSIYINHVEAHQIALFVHTWALRRMSGLGFDLQYH